MIDMAMAYSHKTVMGSRDIHAPVMEKYSRGSKYNT